jgi:hypothetical protein
MRERPILFSAPMVRAILEGRKTQTRRVMKPQPEGFWGSMEYAFAGGVLQCVATRDGKPRDHYIACPYGIPGDRLWVRETAIITPKHWDDMRTFTHRDSEGDKRWVQYLATSPSMDAAKDYGLKVSPSIFMPRWASRIALEITNVRVQRLQEISEEDAGAEGCGGNCPVGHIPHYLAAKNSYEFAQLWDSINAKRGFGWDTNPWVWAITFQKLGAA